MAGKPKSVSISFLFCVLVLVLTGCNQLNLGPAAATDEQIGQTPIEMEKERLLAQLDRKFENPKTHYQLGQLYKTDGLWTQAEYHFKTALSFEPAYRDAQAGRVNVLKASGDERLASLLADEYISQSSVSAEQSLRLGLAFQKELLDDFSLACYKQALRLAPNSAKINRQVGYYYLSKNNTVQATEYLIRSFQLNPHQPEVAGELGRLGIEVRIPRKTTTNTKKLDKMVDKSTAR